MSEKECRRGRLTDGLETQKIGLLAQPETSDDRAVPLRGLLAEVRLKSPPPSYQLEQSASRVIVVLVLTQVVGQLIDALSEKRNLHFGRTDITRMGRIGLDNLSFLLFSYGHSILPINVVSGAS